jgi:ATP citrate (pro-S)-lyase
MKETGDTLGVPLYVFGPETHMTAIVSMALEKTPVNSEVPKAKKTTTANFLLATSSTSLLGQKSGSVTPSRSRSNTTDKIPKISENLEKAATKMNSLFNNTTKAIIWGLQNRAVQGMLDFDFVCNRKEPSVVASVYPFV